MPLASGAIGISFRGSTRLSITVVSAYRTASEPAIFAIAWVFPVHCLARERPLEIEVDMKGITTELRNRNFEDWQASWEAVCVLGEDFFT